MDRDENYKHLNKIDQWIYDMEFEKCLNCKGFDLCEQTNKGMKPVIMTTKYSSMSPYSLASKVCDKKPGVIYGSYKKAVIGAISLFKNESREPIIKHLMKCKGGFVYGSAGIGKSTIMLNVANELRLKGKHIYYELANNVSVSLKEFENNEKKMKLLQNVDVLFIDDFGREVMTNWVILNIWTPILQYRIDNKLPTYITCNYSVDKLYEMIKKRSDEISADVILDRIASIGIFNLEDENYRTKKIK